MLIFPKTGQADVKSGFRPILQKLAGSKNSKLAHEIGGDKMVDLPLYERDELTKI